LDEAHCAVVGFLDQFVARGAASDILALRALLMDDHATRARLDAAMPHAEPTVREAYDGMRAFFDSERTRAAATTIGASGSPNLVLLASWTGWENWDGRTTNDPAQWHDWLGAVSKCAPPSSNPTT
jgi:hypothetical protein